MSKKNIELVIFDLDGTLISSYHHHLCQELVRLSPALLGRKVTLKEAEEAYAANSIGSLLQGESSREVEEKFWSSWSRDTCYPQVTFPWTRKLLDNLKSSNLKLALATSRIEPYEVVKSYLTEQKLIEYFDTIVSLDGRNHRWDEKDFMINDILTSHKISPQCVAFVGDHPEDMRAGVRSNISHNFGVLTGGFSEPTLKMAGAHQVMPSAESLQQFI